MRERILRKIHLINMKTLILLISLISTAYALDRQLAKDYSDLTQSYAPKMKSTLPNKAVVFISSRIDPDYMAVVEVDIDNSDVSDGRIQIQRPNSSSKMRAINTCRGEEGSVTVIGNTLHVNTTKLPTRVICTGDDGNYREAYSTFLK